MTTRRQLLSTLGALPLAGLLGPGKLYAQVAKSLPRRTLGRTGRQVVPFALGGIGSLAHPAEGMDAADIAVRAIQLGINYLDTSNVYGPSQRLYGEAFRRLHLTPDDPHYDRGLREHLYIATKTMGRFSNQPNPAPNFPKDPPPGFSGPWPPQMPPEFRNPAIVDLKRSLTQMFGDGKGYIPEGAYVDCMQIHFLSQMEAVDMIYEGLGDHGSKMPERIGALAGLLDYRDGTNYTGLNSEHRIYVKHIGITGHSDSPTLMSAIRRDKQDVIDTLLVSLNANDRLYGANQNNVLPLAMARGIGVIAMKVFADGAMYGGPKHYLSRPEDVISTVGKPGAVPSADLIRYSLSLPGVTCAVTGIGHIDRERPEVDQLVANLAAGVSDMPSPEERLRIERDVAERQGKDTNFFQDRIPAIVQPTEVRTRKDGDRVEVLWNTAYASAEPIRSYEVRAGEKVLLSLPYRPQLTDEPFKATIAAADAGTGPITVIASTAEPSARA